MAYELKQDDLLCFMHIPKTAGLSIIALLDEKFDKSQIFPWHSVRRTPTPRWLGYIGIRLNRYRLVRGHFTVLCPNNIMRRAMTVDPVVVTFLREPVARVVSDYRHNIRREHIPKETTLWEYITAPQFQHMVVDLQTRWLAGTKRHHYDRGHDWKRYAPEQLLDMALQNLDTIAFFGVVEHFAESVRLMHEHFGWEQAADLPELNRAPKPFDLAELSDRERDELHKRVALDADLYRHALDVFNRRYPGIVTAPHAAAPETH